MDAVTFVPSLKRSPLNFKRMKKIEKSGYYFHQMTWCTDRWVCHYQYCDTVAVNGEKINGIWWMNAGDEIPADSIVIL